MARNLLVTLADRNFLPQAKQLFSSVYWNAGWPGDYMLLAHGLATEEREWFSRKGILVKAIEPLLSEDFDNGSVRYSAVVAGKLHLFSPEFREWETVVYVDADCIVRYPLDALAETRHFTAVCDWLPSAMLGFQAVKPEGMSDSDFGRRLEGYSLKATAFNSGVFAFKTRAIGEKAFETLCGIMRVYQDIGRFPDQLWLNLYFYRRWERLPLEYNLFASYLQRKRGVPHDQIDGVVLHFPRCEDEKGLRCWEGENPFHAEWKRNLTRADLIDLENRPKPARRWPTIRHLAFLMWRVRVAFWRDYLTFYRRRWSVRQRVSELVARVVASCRGVLGRG